MRYSTLVSSILLYVSSILLHSIIRYYAILYYSIVASRLDMNSYRSHAHLGPAQIVIFNCVQLGPVNQGARGAA